MTSGKLTASWVVMALALAAAAAPAHAQSDEASMEIYGFAMLDMGYQFKQNDPNWFDVVRPTKLPASEDQFGEDGHFYSGVRQSRLGVKSTLPTEIGDLKTTFEFELFGVGVDQGQTTFRLRHAYGELGKWGAGQTWSPFMDIDVFPNSIEYWGPTGMAFFRNVQLRYMPIQGDSRLTFALERPGASGDLGEFRGGVPDGTVDLQGHFPAPDVSAEYRMGRGWGYLEAAAIWRYMEWDDLDGTGPDLSGSEIGWGVNLSSNIIMDTANDANDVIRLQVLYGEGVENYMNDAPADVAAIATNDPAHPLDGEALPVLGIVAFLDHYWSDGWSTSVGYSMIDIDNSEGQAADAFKRGHYALANLLHYPAKNVMIGGEFQWGRRENNSDGWEADDYRFQLSARYNFGHTFGGM
jgi:hypothetical protein